MPLSPRTQAFMQPPPSGEDATQAFEQGFGTMAHNALGSKFPELIEQVVTFKVLKSDIDSGSGIGAFIVSLNGDMLHVPVILANNQVKPIELAYYPKKDVFVPLDKPWIDELSRGTLNELGSGVEAPKTLEPDSDIRNLVIPPTTGRYAYASANDQPGDNLVRFLDQSPNRIKRAFAKVLETKPKILKFAFENFDKKALLTAITPSRIELAEVPPLVEFLTPDNSAENFRKCFGKEAQAAWQTAVKQGFVVRDIRHTANVPIETQVRMVRTTAQESGFYELYFKDGSVKLALVIANPQTMKSTLYAGVRGDIHRYPDQYRKHVKKQQAKHVDVNEDTGMTQPAGGFPGDSNFPLPDGHADYVVYTEDGKIMTTHDRPVGKLIHASDIKKEPFSKILDDTVMPVSKGYGLFVRYKAGRIQGTECVDVIETTTDSKGVRRIKTYGNTIVTDPNSPTNVIITPTNGNVTYLPGGFKFLKGERVHENDLLHGADDSLMYINELQKTGALKVNLRAKGDDFFYISGLPECYTKFAALQCLVNDLGLRADAANSLLTKTAEHRDYSFYLVNQEQLRKFASWLKTAKEAPEEKTKTAPPSPPGGGAPPDAAGGLPPGGPGMPPEMAGAPPPDMTGGMPPPEMMAPPPPPPPNPVEIAAEEVGADLANQAAEVSKVLAEHQRDLTNQLSAINAVKQRAMQIAAEQGMGAPLGGPEGPVPQQPGSAEEMAGMPGTPGMPPQGGMPPEAGGMQGMPPEAGGMPGMQGTPPDMPPGGMEGPMISEQLAAQAAPGMEDAAALNDPQAFEATAIGSMAADSDLVETVSEYMPHLEGALDSLGRVMLTLWMKEDELRPELGEQGFSDLERRLRSVFNNLGSLILKINQTALTTREKKEPDAA